MTLHTIIRRIAKCSITTQLKQITEHRNDCPLNKANLGNATWSVMHTVAAYYPDQPTAFQRRKAREFFESLAQLYPCKECGIDYRKYLEKHPIIVCSRKDLNTWLCTFHNVVNKKLGKPEFDCSKVAERWKDGWEDGSCD